MQARLLDISHPAGCSFDLSDNQSFTPYCSDNAGKSKLDFQLNPAQKLSETTCPTNQYRAITTNVNRQCKQGGLGRGY